MFTREKSMYFNFFSLYTIVGLYIFTSANLMPLFEVRYPHRSAQQLLLYKGVLVIVKMPQVGKVQL